jgi:hypothetical protein
MNVAQLKVTSRRGSNPFFWLAMYIAKKRNKKLKVLKSSFKKYFQ